METFKDFVKNFCVFFLLVCALLMVAYLCEILMPRTNRIVSTASIENKSDFRLRYIRERYDRLPILPDGANNFVDKGNGWMTFDLEFNGETKTFLFGRHLNNEINVTIIQIK